MLSANPDAENAINPGLRSVVYCTAISKGDEREWDFLWERLKKTNNANEKTTILISLACTKHIWILKVTKLWFITLILYWIFKGKSQM